ncbi:MAG: hypothetical protein QM778_04885 [Myxococcales bacterium]
MDLERSSAHARAPRVVGVLAAGILWAASSSTAQASPPERPALNWVRMPGAESCIDPKNLGRRVEALTGAVFALSSEADFVIEARVAPTDHGFEAHVVTPPRRSTSAEAGERVLEAPSSDCHALDEALVFVLAVAIDPSLSEAAIGANLGSFAQEVPPEQSLLVELEQQPPVPAPPPQDVSTPAGPSASLPSQRAEVKPTQLHGVVAASANLLGLMLPKTRWGLGVLGDLEFSKRFGVRLAVRAFPWGPRTALGNGSLAVQVYQSALLGCLQVVPVGNLTFALCGGAELSYARGSGEQFVRNHARSLWLPALTASVTARVSLNPRFGFLVDVAGRVGFRSPAFFADQGAAPATFTPGRYGLGLTLGPYFEF